MRMEKYRGMTCPKCGLDRHDVFFCRLGYSDDIGYNMHLDYGPRSRLNGLDKNGKELSCGFAEEHLHVRCPCGAPEEVFATYDAPA